MRLVSLFGSSVRDLPLLSSPCRRSSEIRREEAARSPSPLLSLSLSKRRSSSSSSSLSEISLYLCRREEAEAAPSPLSVSVSRSSSSLSSLCLCLEKKQQQQNCVKFIERGQKINENVQREIMNHRSLKHPHIVRFKELPLPWGSEKYCIGAPLQGCHA